MIEETQITLLPEVERVTLTEADLFAALTEQAKEALIAKEDNKQLKADATFNKKTNPQGIPKEEVALIQAAAKIEANRDFEEKREQADAVFTKYIELSKYDQ